MYKIAVFRGDGIGPEVTEQSVKVIRSLGETFHLVFEIEEALFGGASIAANGSPLSRDALALAVNSDAVLVGAVGDPQYDNLETTKRPEAGLLDLRRKLAVFSNLRPAKVYAELVDNSPLKREVVEGVDLLIVRELTGGIYFGTPRGIEKDGNGVEKGFNTEVYSVPEIERIAEKSFEAARRRRRKVTCVDKANVLESSQLWRRVVTDVHKRFGDIELGYRYVDDCAMQIVRNPAQFDVIVTTNMFGDILSDEAAMLTGSIGMLPSASVGAQYAVYEPVHGSAPDIAGQNVANPLASILSVAMMMEYSFNLLELSQAIEQAVANVLSGGYRTQDLFKEGDKKVSCSEMGDLIVREIKQ